MTTKTNVAATMAVTMALQVDNTEETAMDDSLYWMEEICLRSLLLVVVTDRKARTGWQEKRIK